MMATAHSRAGPAGGRKNIPRANGRVDPSPIKLLAVLDKRCHPHPPQVDYVYKIFIQCEITSGEYNQAFDILDMGFFKQGDLPELSEDRVLAGQIDLMFEYLDDPEKQALID